MKRRVLVVPGFRSVNSLVEAMHVLSFYLSHLELESVVLLARPGVRAAFKSTLAEPAPLGGFDSVTAARLRAMAPRLRVENMSQGRRTLVESADVVLVWDEGRARSWRNTLSRGKTGPQVVALDPRGESTKAARKLAEASYRIGGRGDRIHKARLKRMFEELGHARTAYLVGPARSAGGASSFDMSDGVRIVSGPVVQDRELMSVVRPQVVTLADPVDELGPSAQAGLLRHALAEQASAHDFRVLVPAGSAELFGSLVPELESRIIGVPCLPRSSPINLNLAAVPAARESHNVLTMLMMPLAATLADELALIGFDASEGETGVRGLETYSLAVEVRGKRVVSLTTSQLPALRRRAVATTQPLGPPRLPPDSSSDVLVSVDPDWQDDHGHYAPFNRMLRGLAATRGWSCVALASSALLPREDWQWPTFTHPTRADGLAGAVGGAFRSELAAALDRLDGAAGRLTVVFYTADLWHLPSLLAVVRDSRAHVRVLVNLMRAHEEIVSAATSPAPRQTVAAALLRESLELADTLAVTVAVDTEELSDDVEVLSGRRVPVWPMVSPLDWAGQPPPRTRRDGPVRVYAPIRPQVAKGFCDFAGSARIISQSPDQADFHFVARTESLGAHAPSVVRASLADLESTGATFLWGRLADDDYYAELVSADVVVIPYHVSGILRHEFRTHTSAVLLDAVRAGRPVVVTSGTWLARMVERYGLGATFAEGDAADLARAIRELAGDIALWHKRVAEVRSSLLEQFSAERLWAFLTDPPQQTRTADCDRDDRVGRLVSVTERVLDSAGSRGAMDQFGERQVAAVYRYSRTVELRDRRIGRLRHELIKGRAPVAGTRGNIGDLPRRLRGLVRRSVAWSRRRSATPGRFGRSRSDARGRPDRAGERA